ncbi:MAG: RNA polymerase sigma factor [candidate division Zixibacteria bacterium]|nr:RNA polymerase sigma factor [candidate division Zixibacteria bacterium]
MTSDKDREEESMTNDSALVMSIGTGDKKNKKAQKAFEKLVERHKKTAYRVALGMVGNKDDAFDISQEAFLRVYKSANTFDKSQPFLPWFYTIIANLCRTWLRRRTTHDYRMVDVDDASYLLVSDDNPEEAMIKKQQAAGLREALMELSFADREIVVLQHFRNLSYDEIATMLDIPRGTVMSRLYYARKRLAKLMRQNDE